MDGRHTAKVCRRLSEAMTPLERQLGNAVRTATARLIQ
jgi:hypothetical protein